MREKKLDEFIKNHEKFVQELLEYAKNEPGSFKDSIAEIIRVISDYKALSNRVQDQQAEIDSLSMAHDAIHREMPKDKHSLIKNIIRLNKRVQELEKDNEDIRWMCANMSITLQELEKQNKRYKELINTIIYRLDGRETYSENTVIDAIQIDVYKFMEGEE